MLLSGSPWGLTLKQRLLPQYLKDLGYITHAIGKWHLGFFRKEYIPTNRGFDSHTGFWTSSEDYYNHWMSERGFEGFDFRHNTEVNRNATGIYSTDYFTDRAIDLIEEHNVSKPLFLYMAYQSVHSANKGLELQAPKQLIDKFSYIKDYTRRLFAATLYSMDLSIGKIVNQLNKRQLLDNTIILFLSDNGGAISGLMGQTSQYLNIYFLIDFFKTENSASNYPLRGTKGTLWEGGVRVPAFIWSPLLKNSGYLSDNYIQVVDWIPTLLEAIDGSYAKTNQKSFDGTSVWKELNEKKCRLKNELLLNIDPIWNMSSIIVNDWKLIQGTIPRNVVPNPDQWSPSFKMNGTDSLSLERTNSERIESNVYKVLTKIKRKVDFDFLNQTLIDCGKHKNAILCDSNSVCLFNVKSDPCEYNNLASYFPTLVKNLWQKILNYNKTVVSPLNKPIDPKSNPIYHNSIWDIWVH